MRGPKGWHLIRRESPGEASSVLKAQAFDFFFQGRQSLAQPCDGQLEINVMCGQLPDQQREIHHSFLWLHNPPRIHQPHGSCFPGAIQGGGCPYAGGQGGDIGGAVRKDLGQPFMATLADGNELVYAWLIKRQRAIILLVRVRPAKTQHSQIPASVPQEIADRVQVPYKVGHDHGAVMGFDEANRRCPVCAGGIVAPKVDA